MGRGIAEKGALQKDLGRHGRQPRGQMCGEECFREQHVQRPWGKTSLSGEGVQGTVKGW